MSSICNERQYIDPWDLENIIYLRKKMGPEFNDNDLSESPAGEPVVSRFYYVPGEYEDYRRYSRRAEEPAYYGGCYDMNDEYIVCNNYTDTDSASGDQLNSFGSASTLRLCTPNFGLTRMVMPKPNPMDTFSFPEPPAPVPFIDDTSSGDERPFPEEMAFRQTRGSDNYYSLGECIHCMCNNEEHVPFLDDPQVSEMGGETYSCLPPNHFGLDKRGLLLIDYSCNWNNLHLYIAKNAH